MDEINIDRSIGRVEGKLDMVIGQVTELNQSFKSLEAGRLTTLERQFSNLTGKLTVVMFVISTGLSVFLYVIQHYLLK